jgi:hypothetical protein
MISKQLNNPPGRVSVEEQSRFPGAVVCRNLQHSTVGNGSRRVWGSAGPGAVLFAVKNVGPFNPWFPSISPAVQRSTGLVHPAVVSDDDLRIDLLASCGFPQVRSQMPTRRISTKPLRYGSLSCSPGFEILQFAPTDLRPCRSYPDSILDPDFKVAPIAGGLHTRSWSPGLRPKGIPTSPQRISSASHRHK